MLTVQLIISRWEENNLLSLINQDMRLTLVIIMASVLYSCTSAKFINASKQIDKNCNGNNKWKGKSFHALRTQLYKEGKLGFLSSGFDTLYILESYDIESGNYIGRLWNENGTVSYTYHNNSFSFEQSNLFTDYTIQLVQNWDTVGIRREENRNGVNLPERYITASRVIGRDKEFEIVCIKFKDFFDPKRDR